MKWLLSWNGCHLGEAIWEGFGGSPWLKVWPCPAPDRHPLGTLIARCFYLASREANQTVGWTVWEGKAIWDFSNFFPRKSTHLSLCPHFPLSTIKMVYVSPLDSANSLESLRGGAVREKRMQPMTVLTKKGEVLTSDGSYPASRTNEIWRFLPTWGRRSADLELQVREGSEHLWTM